MIKAIKVEANNDFHIIIKLEDGRLFDLDMSFITKESGTVVAPLKNIEEFKKVFIRNGIVTWPSGFDIDPYYLETHGTLVNKSA